MINCILAGVGGQGTVLASKIIAEAAMTKGWQVRTAETIGMAQRGGCVVSHVRIGDKINSPLLPLKSADIIVGFEPAEAVRCLAYLRENGIVVVNQKGIKPVTASLSDSDYDGRQMLTYLRNQIKNLVVVNGESICAACGSSRVLNMALLGAAVSTGALGISYTELEKAVRKLLPAKLIDLNILALTLGSRINKKENGK
ncbi:MAG: indolepyruvate oxidoreductase subunit beta [Desulfotomaculaceae bacterium]|nr:indolepyruvate oxidoreductase subunit beta [Desulfotomaculaceae bacterium]MDD4767699.1 indolepyruvate oxidoreductase subunit beta [Desulfotomaculaceae bacterium]